MRLYLAAEELTEAARAFRGLVPAWAYEQCARLYHAGERLDDALQRYWRAEEGERAVAELYVEFGGEG